MKLLPVVVIVLFVQLLGVTALHTNSFDVIRGCRQYENVEYYNSSLTYLPTSSLLHVGHTDYSKYFKIAVVGTNDGIIRYGQSMFPHGKVVMEIVLGGWGNTNSAGRRQHLTASNNVTSSLVEILPTPNLMSQFRPTMFVLEVFHNGTVQVKIDGQDHPFLSFIDDKRIPANYIAFTKWDREVIYFYDCPLDNANNLYNYVLLNCTVV